MTIPIVDPVLDAVAWPGENPRGRILPGLAAAALAILAGPRAGLWQLATWTVIPLGDHAKTLFHRPRPFPGRLNPRGGMPQDPSFPSSHAMEYVVVFGFASWLLHRRRSVTSAPVAIVSACAIALIGPSRVRTGDHRWSDVGGGYGLGALVLTGLIAVARRDSALAPTLRSRRRVSATPSGAVVRTDPSAMVGCTAVGPTVPITGRLMPA